MGIEPTIDETIVALECLGLRLLDRAAIHPEETDPHFVLTSEGGMAFLHVLAYDAEMIEEPDAYADWVRLWARATEKAGQVSDIDSDIDFDADTGWLPEECVAECCELFPEAVRG